MTDYFTEREFGPVPRSLEFIGERLWGALVGLIEVRLDDHSFGYGFPAGCPDGEGPCGCNDSAFARMLEGEIPEIEWPLRPGHLPDTPVILDLLEFCAGVVGEPIEGVWHGFYRHYHLRWDREAGLARFIADVNRLLRRNGIAFELSGEGKAQRILPEPMREPLGSARFSTGDALTDQMLEGARERIMRPQFDARRDALEKLWDAFERIKTLEPGADKRTSAEALLNRAAAPGSILRNSLGQEARALTEIGNNLGIRHSETKQEHVTAADQVDYLFIRMFAFLHLVLKSSGRAT